MKRGAEKQITQESAQDETSDNEMIEERGHASAEVLASRKIIKVKRSSALPGEADTAFGGLQAPLAALTPKPTMSPKASAMSSSPKNLTLFDKVAPASPRFGTEVSSTSPKASSSPKASTSPKASASPKAVSKIEVSANPFAGLLESPLPTPASSPQPTGLFSGFASFGNFSSFSGGFGTFGEEAAEVSGEEETQKEEPSLPALTEVLSGEEGETLVYQHDCKLFRLVKGDDEKMRWTDKGSGFIRVLQNSDKSKMRVVVRMKGVLRVILNSPVLAGFTKEGQKSVKFPVMESDGSLAWARVNLLQLGQPDIFIQVTKID